MSRFNEGYVFDEPPLTGSPASVNILLNRLGVDFAPQEDQRAAVAGWLVENTPGPCLRVGLAWRGFTVQ